MEKKIMDTIQDSRYDEFFGFTQAEVDRLLGDAKKATTEISKLLRRTISYYELKQFL